MKKPFTVDHLLSIRRVTDRVPMHLSPDGRWLAVSVRGTSKARAEPLGLGFRADGVYQSAVGSRVLVIDTATGEALEPFPPGSTSWGGRWSPDGGQLAVCLRHDGVASLATWSLETRNWQLFPQAPVRGQYGFEVPRWAPDGHSVIMKLWPASGSARRASRDDASDAGRDQEPVTVFAFDRAEEVDTRPTGEWLFDGSGCDLGCVDVNTGEVGRLCIDWALRSWQVAPDGNGVAVLKMAEYDPPNYRMLYDLVVVPLDGSSPRTIAKRVWNAYGVGFNWSPDSRYIAYAMRSEREGARVFVVPADGSEQPKDLIGDRTIRMNEYMGPVWSADGRSVTCLARDAVWTFALDGNDPNKVPVELSEWRIRFWIQPPLLATSWPPEGRSSIALVQEPASKQEGLVRVDLTTGEATALTAFTQTCVGPFEVEVASDGSTCYLVMEAADHPPEIWRASLNTHGLHRLCALSPGFDGVALGKARVIEWRGADTQLLRGALLLPPSYVRGQPIPLVVHLYDSDLSNMIHDFGFGGQHFDNAQLLASRGYAVLWPDLPLRSRDPMRQLPGLVMPAVNRLIEIGIADPNRLGLMGHSYGGYCVMALLTQVDCFRAAVACAGDVNLTSAYGHLSESGDSSSGYFEAGQGRMGATLWERRDAYIENSPLFYLDRVRTPLLLVCGSEDQKAAMQARQTFAALRRLGRQVELRLYGGEGHWPGDWSESSLRNVCDRVLGWFHQHLAKRGKRGDIIPVSC